uniref:Odorant-binding protein 15 n=1 Tax=Lygus lineolaris TaxID=50650 RepID=W0HI00_LYGLI|nr:odorant-binding protein 15 [Lygus lineolaris]
MMKIAFVTSVLVVLATVSAITPELDKKAKEAVAKCADVPGINEAKKEDCYAACFMTEMGYMTDGKINVENMEEANRQKWDDQQMINKGIEIDKTCAKQVGDTKGKSECAIGYDFGVCKTRLVKATGLQPPTPLKQ